MEWKGKLEISPGHKETDGRESQGHLEPGGSCTPVVKTASEEWGSGLGERKEREGWRI